MRRAIPSVHGRSVCRTKGRSAQKEVDEKKRRLDSKKIVQKEEEISSR
jgi:hypothetical protein